MSSKSGSFLLGARTPFYSEWRTVALGRWRWLAAAFAMAFCCSCAANQDLMLPRQVDPRFAEIQSITMLPVVVLADIDEDRRARFTDKVYERLALELAIKGYVVERAVEYAPGRVLAAEDLAAMDESLLAQLGPPGARYIIICYVTGRENLYLVMAESAQTNLAAVLIDRETGTVVWRDEAEGSYVTSIFDMGLLMPLVIDEDYSAITDGFEHLFETFPSKN